MRKLKLRQDWDCGVVFDIVFHVFRHSLLMIALILKCCKIVPLTFAKLSIGTFPLSMALGGFTLKATQSHPTGSPTETETGNINTKLAGSWYR